MHLRCLSMPCTCAVISFLADVLPDGGGETHLPLATPMHEDGATPSIRHDKDKGGVRVVPRMVRRKTGAQTDRDTW